MSCAVTRGRGGGNTALESLASHYTGVNELATDCDRAQGVCGLSGAVRPA